MNKIYLDYASTTPVDKRVFAAMKPFFGEKFGNAGSLHSFGQEAMAAVDAARENVASRIGAEFREIIFTGSATEANNLAIKGSVKAFIKRNPGIKPEVIVSEIEHDSVFKTCKALEESGTVDVGYLKVGKDGVVKIKDLCGMMNDRTVLVSVMSVNNETGVLQPIKKIGEIVNSKKGGSRWPLFHSDCVQALQFFDCSPQKTGADLLVFSGHKIYGPKGIGCLFVRKGSAIESVIHGGGQEYGLRSGTENVPLVVGFSKAVSLLGGVAEKNKEAEKIECLSAKFLNGIKKIWGRAELNFSGSPRLPHITSIYFPGETAESLLVKLDLSGIAASSGSACSARSFSNSRILQACGFKGERLRSSLRFSFGRNASEKEVDEALKIMKNL